MKEFLLINDRYTEKEVDNILIENKKQNLLTI